MPISSSHILLFPSSPIIIVLILLVSSWIGVALTESLVTKFIFTNITGINIDNAFSYILCDMK